MRYISSLRYSYFFAYTLYSAMTYCSIHLTAPLHLIVSFRARTAHGHDLHSPHAEIWEVLSRSVSIFSIVTKYLTQHVVTMYQDCVLAVR